MLAGIKRKRKMEDYNQNQGDGLYKKKYHIQRVKIVQNPDYDPGSILGLQPAYIEEFVPVSDEAEYFVLRLEEGGKDLEHIKACRIGVHAYADAISHHLPQLAIDLKERYPLLTL